MLFAAFLLSMSATAQAQDPPLASSSAKPPYDKHLSVTFSPLHLAFPMLEVTTEGRLADKVGLAGVLGFGTYSGWTIVEVGSQFRYYALGSFDHGMELGGEALLLHAVVDSGGTSGTGVGYSVGPFVGYKIAARFGLTFDAQLGATIVQAAATASNSGQSASATQTGIGPLLNLNLGWSF